MWIPEDKLRCQFLGAIHLIFWDKIFDLSRDLLIKPACVCPPALGSQEHATRLRVGWPASPLCPVVFPCPSFPLTWPLKSSGNWLEGDSCVPLFSCFSKLIGICFPSTVWDVSRALRLFGVQYKWVLALSLLAVYFLLRHQKHCVSVPHVVDGFCQTLS